MNIVPSSSSSSASNFLTGVRHENGLIEADLTNFSGKIVISEEAVLLNGPLHVENVKDGEPHVVVNAVPEEPEHHHDEIQAGKSLQVDGFPFQHLVRHTAPPETAPHNMMINNGHFGMNYNIDDPSHLREESSKLNNEENKIQAFEQNLLHTRLDQSNHKKTQATELSFHEACGSEYVDIYDLRAMLKAKPELAAMKDELGEYPAHIFANNDSFMFSQSDGDVEDFVTELYAAYPEAFFTDGFLGQIPFADAIVEWIDDSHQLYERNFKGVSVSNLW